MPTSCLSSCSSHFSSICISLICLCSVSSMVARSRSHGGLLSCPRPWAEKHTHLCVQPLFSSFLLAEIMFECVCITCLFVMRGSVPPSRQGCGKKNNRVLFYVCVFMYIVPVKGLDTSSNVIFFLLSNVLLNVLLKNLFEFFYTVLVLYIWSDIYILLPSARHCYVNCH